MKSVTTALTLLVCCFLGWSTDLLAADGGTAVGEAEIQVRQAQALVVELADDVKQLHAHGFDFVPEERFIDAHVFFDLEHYGKSALLLVSLLEDSRFKKDKKYFEAVKLLGISLFNVRNYQGANQQFQRLLDAGVERSLATTYLIEIASLLGREDDLVRLANTIQAGSADHGLLYAKGKALYFTARYQEAADVLRSVDQGAPSGLKAMYVSGAALVAMGRMDDARRVFELFVQQEPQSDDEKRLQELGYLSLGRLAYEQNDYSAAADIYQQIPRQSPYFEQAMYEVTHVHLGWANSKTDLQERLTAFDKAEEILDILVSITQDPHLARDARVLRGRISMFLEKYELAEASYQEVIEMFASTSSEMTDIAQSPESIDRFFQAMIKGGDSARQLNLFVSEEVVDWMRNQPTLGRVVDMLTDVAEQRAALEEARTIYEQLIYSLDQDAARELFPGFSDCWLKSLEVENRLLTADGMLLDYQQKLVRKKFGTGDESSSKRFTAERARLLTKLETAPRTVGGYKARNKELMSRLRDLAKDADEQVRRIYAIQEQYLAAQKLLKEIKYKGSHMLVVKDQAVLESEIQTEGDKLIKLLQEAEGFRAEVEKEMLVAEVGDPRGQSESDIKAKLWSLHSDEAQFYFKLGQGLSATERSGVERASDLRREIILLLDSTRRMQGVVDDKAQKQIKYYKKVLAGEDRKLVARERDIAATEKAAMAFARKVGKRLFLDAKEELVRAVVEADLGLVDLTWKRKENETNRINEIQNERADVVQRLRDDLQAIAGEEEETQ
jgi:tetratricopeptide (TPR) repeat protein